MISKPVLCIGEILIDLIANDGERGLLDVSNLAVRAGGAPANAAVAVARMRVPTRFCGVIGADPLGERLRAVIKSHGVDDRSLRSSEHGSTSLAFAWRDHRGDGRFRLLRMADLELSPEQVESAGIEDCAAIIVGSVSLAGQPSRSAIYKAIAIANERGLPVVADVNVRPSLWTAPGDLEAACQPLLERSTLLKLSLDDTEALFGTRDMAKIASRMPKPWPKFVVITDGARGSWVMNLDSTTLFQPAFPVQAVDPTGAGDAFTGALVARLVNSGWNDLSEADLRFAAAAGAITATRQGGIDALPTRAEVDAFLTANA